MSEEQTDRNNMDEEELSKMNDKKERPGESAEESTKETPVAGEGEPESGTSGDIEELKKQLDETRKQADSYKDQLLRLAAEFENFRKRTEVEKAEFVKYSHEKIIKDLLPILDDFERALANGKKSSDFDAFYKGVEMIRQKLQKVFEEKGVKPIESLGKEFDVMYHDVLMQMQKPGVAPHTIVEEVERGYTLHGKVIKHAKVVVAAEPSGDDESGAGSSN